MVDKDKKVKPLKYFFYNGALHRKIHINRTADVVTAWKYSEYKSVRYVYSDVKKYGGQAFTTTQVAEMVGRSAQTIKLAIARGEIRPPEKTYSLKNHHNTYGYYWSEEQVLDLHDYLVTVHRGRPRKDGLITISDIPTRAELKAMMRHGTVFFVKVGDEFVPTWQAHRI